MKTLETVHATTCRTFSIQSLERKKWRCCRNIFFKIKAISFMSNY